MDKEVSDNSMDSTLANVNGRLENLATCTEPTIVYSSEREVAATHHLGKVLGIHRDTNDGLDVIACDVINPDHIDVEFELIGGLESIKQALYELVILHLRKPELFSHGKLLGPQKGVLLYGPL
ncbi:hypothetical protein Peur_034266 [Populus x canadensis]